MRRRERGNREESVSCVDESPVNGHNLFVPACQWLCGSGLECPAIAELAELRGLVCPTVQLTRWSALSRYCNPIKVISYKGTLINKQEALARKCLEEGASI